MLQKPEDLNQFKSNYSVFMRSSRDASRQCLFFLSVPRKTNQEKIDAILTDFSEYALIKVKALTNGIKLPNRDDTDASDCMKKNLYYWQKKIIEKLDNMKTLSLEEVPVLKERFVNFLKITREDDIKQCLQYHIIPLVIHFAIKNIYLILGVILVGIVLFFVDVVSNLLFNEGWYLFLPLIGLFAGLAASTAVIVRRPGWIIGWGDFFNPWVVPPGRGIQRWPKEKFETQNLISKRILLTALMTACFLMVIGLVLWIIEVFAPAFLGKTSLTIYILLGLAFLFLLLCHLVDMWDFYDPRHIRLAALGLGFFFLAATLTTAHARLAALVVLISLTFFASVSIKRHPKDALRWILALLFLVSTILTVRGHFTVKEAVWTHKKSDDRPVADIRIEVDEWPYKISEKDNYPIVVMAASGGGSRAALYTALTLKNLNLDFAHIASKLHVISSVSGGSLATAVYISELYNAYKQGQEPDLTNLDQRINQDYLRPTLVGALWPGASRGDKIEDSWRKNPVGLGNISISNLSEAWRKAKKKALEFPPFPLPLFNSCSLDGHDIVISPLPQETYLWDKLYDQEIPRSKWRKEGNLTWVFSRNAIYGFEKLLDRFDPLVYQAVRASANFPFGFPLVQIETDAPLSFNPNDEKSQQGLKTVKLTDGGVLSNSGMWSLFGLLMKNAPELKKRGVLLIVVEASKMPEYRDNRRSLNSLYGAIGDSNPVGQNLHRRMFDLLAKEYGHRLAVVQIDIIPTDKYNVLTTWALDKRSEQDLRDSFDRRWEEESQCIEEKWRSIQKTKTEGKLYIPGSFRPPLS